MKRYLHGEGSSRGNAVLTAKQVQRALQRLADPPKARASAWFFKFPDRFRGVTVPEQRTVVKQFRDLPLSEIDKLLTSAWHEDRLTGVLILVQRFLRQRRIRPWRKKSTTEEQIKLTKFYLQHTAAINNWDLVDSSAEYLAGQDVKLLRHLAQSKSLWERRIAMIATYQFIKKGNPKPTLTIAQLLLKDKEDLIHKAVGWMLREVGKRCSLEAECAFLDEFYQTMPRTMLRYAIEKFPQSLRLKYLQK